MRTTPTLDPNAERLLSELQVYNAELKGGDAGSLNRLVDELEDEAVIDKVNNR